MGGEGPPLTGPAAEPLFLIGASTGAEEHAARHARQIAAQGFAADWWSFPLNEAKEEAIKASPYLYIYTGRPLQQLRHRFRIVEYKTSTGDQGIPCPWPDFVEEQYREKTRASAKRDDIFKTWFLLDRIEPLDPPVRLGDLEKTDGTPADPSTLVGGFALWRPRTLVPMSRLNQLAQLTNFTPAQLQELESLLRQKKQIILEGPPGSGKTYVADLLGRYVTR